MQVEASAHLAIKLRRERAVLALLVPLLKLLVSMPPFSPLIGRAGCLRTHSFGHNEWKVEKNCLHGS